MGLENHPSICSTTELQSIYVNVVTIQHRSQGIRGEIVAWYFFVYEKKDMGGIHYYAYA